MTPERHLTILKVLDNRQVSLAIITDQVHKGRHIAVIMKACDAVGFDTDHLVAPVAGFQRYRGTATGSQKRVTTKLYEHVRTRYKKYANVAFKFW